MIVQSLVIPTPKPTTMPLFEMMLVVGGVVVVVDDEVFKHVTKNQRYQIRV